MTPRDLSVDSNPTPVTAAATHITNPRLLNLARIAWIVFFIVNVGSYLCSTLPTIAQTPICEEPPSSCFPTVPRIVADQLAQWGFASAGEFAAAL